jgi:uncharacterized protein
LNRELIDRVAADSLLASSYDHGERHWRAVAAVGRRLVEVTPGADAELVFLFALFHDARRVNEHTDPEHGARGAALARELLDLDPTRLDVLCDACARHNGARNSTHPTIGCCFDADRLNLPRVGIEPDAQYLSTLGALDEDLAAWARTVHDQAPSWDELLTAFADVTISR